MSILSSTNTGKNSLINELNLLSNGYEKIYLGNSDMYYNINLHNTYFIKYNGAITIYRSVDNYNPTLQANEEPVYKYLITISKKDKNMLFTQLDRINIEVKSITHLRMIEDYVINESNFNFDKIINFK